MKQLKQLMLLGNPAQTYEIINPITFSLFLFLG